MSLYSEYLLEHTDDQIIENESGFVTYRFDEANKSVYIVDIYVVPDQRKKGAASALADEVVKLAKPRGYQKLYGSVVPSFKGSTTSLKVLLGYGMTLDSSTNGFILFKKDI